MPLDLHFPIKIYKEYIHSIDVEDLKKMCFDVELEDQAGGLMCIEKFPFGYTSYFTHEHIHDPIMGTLMSKILPHAYEYAKILRSNLDGDNNFQLKVFSEWINIGRKYNYHPVHNHANCFISGIFYLTDVSGIKFFNFNAYQQEGVYYDSRPNLLLLWPGWLYHEAQQIMVDGPKMSISFNIGLFTE